MLGLCGRIACRSVPRAISTTQVHPTRYYCAKPDAQEEIRRLSREAKLRPGEDFTTTGNNYVPFSPSSLGTQTDAHKIESLCFPFVPTEMEVPFEVLARHWKKKHLALKDHWEAEYVAACMALNHKINELGCYQDFTLVELVKANVGEVSELACAVYNHHLFFSGLIPLEKPYPRHKKLCRLIDDSFGSFGKFKKLFSSSAKKLFGSGWVFLAAAPDGTLHIITTEVNGNPHQIGMYPLLALDLWEHAYYAEDSYIDSFWEVVDWESVGKQLELHFPAYYSEPYSYTENVWHESDESNRDVTPVKKFK